MRVLNPKLSKLILALELPMFMGLSWEAWDLGQGTRMASESVNGDKDACTLDRREDLRTRCIGKYFGGVSNTWGTVLLADGS